MQEIFPKINLQFFAEEDETKAKDVKSEPDKDKKKKEGEPAKQEDPNEIGRAHV